MGKIVIAKETKTGEYISAFTTWKRATDYARFERGFEMFISRGSTGQRWYYATRDNQQKAKESGNYGLFSVLSLCEIPCNIELKVRGAA